MAAAAGTGRATDKIRIGYPPGMHGQLPVVMQRVGLDRVHGFEGEFITFPHGEPVIDALVAGEIDAAVLGYMAVADCASRAPDDMQIIAALGMSRLSLVVPKASSAQVLHDLRGQRVGFAFHSAEQLEFFIAAKEEGLDAERDFTLLNIPVAQLPLALSNGVADAIMIRQPQLLHVKEELGARELRTRPMRFLSVMRRSCMRRHPGIAGRYQSALRASIYYTATHPEKASQWFGEQSRIARRLVRAVIAETPSYHVTRLDDVDLTLKPVERDELQSWFRHAFDLRLIRKAVTLDTLLPQPSQAAGW
ncbi:MAG TPA: ABC transporter substrate-binding protein [Pseudolabrys sp.]|nr:ABC transporter substrate-binding protein [Pseudolabrys sp.]